MARVWAEIEALGLTTPELRLIEACKAGQPCNLGEDRPETSDPARTIRAEVLRYLILGGCADCRLSGMGVALAGAYVSGRLDLSYAAANGSTFLHECRFAKGITASQTRFVMLSLNGSAVPGLDAPDAQVEGNVFLQFRFEATGEVNLSGARIGGQLSCVNGKFFNLDGCALNLGSARVTGGVYLNDGFSAMGAVWLAGANIGGQLDCAKGTFRKLQGSYALNAHGAIVAGSVFFSAGFSADGEVCLPAAKIGGQLECDGGSFRNPEGITLNGQGLTVSQGLLWRGVTVAEGRVYFTSAHVGDLVDDLESWPGAGRLFLDGFNYDRISGGFTDSAQRLDWLSRGTVWKEEFYPQPYTQLAKVLREMGHDRGARDVLVEQGRLIALHGRARALGRVTPGQFAHVRWAWVWSLYRGPWLLDVLSRLVIGYGHKPFRSLWALGFLWLAAIILAEMAWRSGAMVPNSDVMLNSARWAAVAQGSHPAAAWIASFPAGEDWETFNRFAWGFDVVVPILNVGQTDAWAPAYGRGIWGQAAWWGRWVLSVFGWIVAALAAAAVTGIIQRDRR
jgi:hypothetical protein